jgi:hypothetical protein
MPADEAGITARRSPAGTAGHHQERSANVHQEFACLVVEVDDPAATAAAIRQAIGDAGATG